MTVSCHAFIHSKKAKVTGGKKTVVKLKTPKDWCDFYGVPVKNGIAILYKGVEEGYSSHHDNSFKYIPGTSPEAKDWDGGKQECGKGLHFSPHPKMVKEFISNPKHYLACPVALKDMVIHPEGSYPQKCKAKKVCKPCWEIDENGEKISPSKV